MNELKFIYTYHCKIRIKQRALPKNKIEETINKADKAMFGFKHRIIARKNFGGKKLEVVYRKTYGKIFVITAYWLEEK